MTRIDESVLAVLSEAETDGPALRLPAQLDRKLYLAVDKVLTSAGGRWNRGAKAHLFSGDAGPAVEVMILTGEAPESAADLNAVFGFFETPSAVVDRLIELADLRPGLLVLEPSAGRGAIARRVAEIGCRVDCVEIQESNVMELKALPVHVGGIVEADFLDVDPTPSYDRVLMNPPFARLADVRHVNHALRFLRPEGRLVSVMSSGVTFRTDRLAAEFRSLVAARGGSIEVLPAESFKASGTLVQTVIATIPA